MSPKNQPALSPPKRPLLIVLSGPSGVGKDAVLSRMRELRYPLEYITTVTTRPRRASERDHIDYYFVSAAKFQKMIKNNELLEWANVYDNWYGVPRGQITQALDSGQDTIIKVEIKQLSLFDYVVFSQRDEIYRAVADIAAIITAEKCRVTPREITFPD